MEHGSSWSNNLTEEQNNLCYEIQFSLIRAIINFDHDTMWEFMLKALESEQKKGEGFKELLEKEMERLKTNERVRENI